MSSTDGLNNKLSAASLNDSSPNYSEPKRFETKVKSTRTEYPEVPIDVIQYALELEDENNDADIKKYNLVFNTVIRKSSYGLTETQKRIRGSLFYEALQDNSFLAHRIEKKSIDIYENIHDSKVWLISLLNNSLADPTTAQLLQSRLSGRSYQDNYKEMLKVPKLIMRDNSIVLDLTANDRMTRFLTFDLIDLVDHVFFNNWFYMDEFLGNKSLSLVQPKTGNSTVQVKVTQARKVDLSKVGIIKVKLIDITFRRITPRNQINNLSNKDIGIEEVLDIQIQKDLPTDPNEEIFYCVVLMNDKNDASIKLKNIKGPIVVDDSKTEVTLIMSPSSY